MSSESTTSTVLDYRLAAELTVDKGTVESGDVKTTHRDDAVFLSVKEVAEIPGFNFNFLFENVPAEPLAVHVHGYYEGSAAHRVKIYAWNYLIGLWVPLTTDADDFPTASSEQWYTFLLPTDIENYIDAGELLLRLYHIDAGIATHHMYIDYIVLES